MDALARELARTVKVASMPESNLSGSVTDYGSMTNSVPALPSFVYQLDNSAGTVTANYLIGDPTGMIAAAVGGSYSAPSSLNGQSTYVTPNKNFLYACSILFGEISWRTSSDVTQFDNNPTVYVCNQTGQFNQKPIMLTAAQRNTQYNSLLLTTKGQFRLDAFRAILVPVIAGEIVTVSMAPVAYTI